MVQYDYLRPNGIGDLDECDYQYPYSGEHWDKVDDITPDESQTVAGSALLYYTPTDLFMLPNGSQTGHISKVTIYIRAKTGNTPASTFKIVIKTHGTLYYGPEEGPASYFLDFSKMWTENPYTNKNWTWDEITNLQIGYQTFVVIPNSGIFITQEYIEVEFNVGTTDTLRPNTVGDSTTIGYQYPENGQHYEKVDEAQPDGYSTYVAQQTGMGFDLYGLDDGSGIGSIAQVKTYCCVIRQGAGGTARLAIKTHGTVYYGAYQTPDYQNYWQTYSEIWLTNPYTGEEWTWSEIVDLQIGIELVQGASWVSCTQVYVEVDHTGDIKESESGHGTDAPQVTGYLSASDWNTSEGEAPSRLEVTPVSVSDAGILADSLAVQGQILVAETYRGVEFAWRLKGYLLFGDMDIPNVTKLRIRDATNVDVKKVQAGLPKTKLLGSVGRIVEIKGTVRQPADVDVLHGFLDGQVRAFTHATGDSFAALAIECNPILTDEMGNWVAYTLTLAECAS